MVKAKRRKSKSPKTIDLKADAVFEESAASKETDAALEAGLSAQVDVVVDDFGNSDAVGAKADIVVDDAVIEAAKNEVPQNSDTGTESVGSKNTNENTSENNGKESAVDAPIIASVKKKSRFGLYAGTFISALVGGGIALGGAGALNKVGWLKYVPYASGLVYGGDTSKEAAALETAQAEINALKVQITELSSSSSSSAVLIERIAALEASVSDAASADLSSIDLSSIENAVKSASEKSDLANQNAKNALVQINELSTKIVTTAGGIDSDVLKDILAEQSSDLAQVFESRIFALESKSEITPVDTSKTISQVNEVAQSVTSLSSRIDVVEKESQHSSATVMELLTSELALINAKIDNEILAPMAEVQAAASAAMTGQKVAYSVTARSLKAALDHGGKFSSEVFAVQALLGENETLNLLKPIAEKGVQTPKQLLVGFKVVEDKIFDFESKPTKDAGMMDKFLSSAKSLIKIRPKGAVDGANATAVASRVRLAISNGDLDVAKTEWEGLPEAAKDISANWYEGLSTRIEAGNLVSKLIELLSVTASPENKG